MSEAITGEPTRDGCVIVQVSTQAATNNTTIAITHYNLSPGGVLAVLQKAVEVCATRASEQPRIQIAPASIADAVRQELKQRKIPSDGPKSNGADTEAQHSQS